MNYVLAIDGGGTKTEALIGDDKGNILGMYRGGSSNHQIVGSTYVKQTISDVMENVCIRTNIESDKLSYIYIGIAGADFDSDFTMLDKLLNPIFKNIPYNVVNDSWIALSAGTLGGWGVVSVCGTGNNVAVKDKNGKKKILRALSYDLGNYGGGNHLVREVLHHSCRCDENTGPYTRLVEEIPKLMKVKNMEQVVYSIYMGDICKEQLNNVVQLVFDLALDNDLVSQEIIIKMGSEIGKMITGLVNNMKMTKMEIPIVLAGSIYEKTKSTLLIDSLRLSVRRSIPKFSFIKLNCSPVLGAYIEALRGIGTRIDRNDLYWVKKYEEMKKKLTSLKNAK